MVQATWATGLRCGAFFIERLGLLWSRQLQQQIKSYATDL